MDCYIGLDIGTTNSKAIALRRDGTTEIIYEQKTKKYHSNDIEFFSIDDIEHCMNLAIQNAQEKYTVKGISFSSVGESVVPVEISQKHAGNGAFGKALCDPLVWYDKATRTIAETLHEKVKIERYESRGVSLNYTMGLFKMLFMKDGNIVEKTNHPYTFLSIADYLAYRLTEKAYWDYSQACRSYLFDIHDRKWDSSLLSSLGFDMELPTCKPTGSYAGSTKTGIPVYLGGHDHIIGMYGIKLLFGSETLFYSMGSAAVLGGFTEGKGISKQVMKERMKRISNLTIGACCSESDYYIENSLRYFGKLHDALASFFGSNDPKGFYDTMNDIIEKDFSTENLPVFYVEGDRITKEGISGFELRNIQLGTNPIKVVTSLYTYMGIMTKIILDELSFHFPLPQIVAGGGIVRNRLMLQFISDIIGQPIRILQEKELSALGAALCAANGAGDTEIIKRAQQRIKISQIEPSPHAIARKETAEKMYKNFYS
jgi:sugar (pentulose or hexulose) kinase